MFTASLMCRSDAGEITIRRYGDGDQALFEADCRADGRKSAKGENSALTRLAGQRWKMPARKAYQEPQGLDVGADVALVAGTTVRLSGQVWAQAHSSVRGPHMVWIAGDNGRFWLCHDKGGRAYGPFPYLNDSGLRAVPAAEVQEVAA